MSEPYDQMDEYDRETVDLICQFATNLVKARCAIDLSIDHEAECAADAIARWIIESR